MQNFQKGVRETAGRVVLLLVLATLVLASAGAFFTIHFTLRWFESEMLVVRALKTHYPHFKADKGRGAGRENPTILRAAPAGWVPLSKVSSAGIDAIVISEDWAFFEHKGYDPYQIREALRADIRERRYVRGASTITQQVVRNVFLQKGRLQKSLWRKLKEIYLAIELEKAVGKKRILEIYLNIAEWGDGVFGIGQASQHYFGKHPESLSAKEGAFLAMLLPSPKRYDQSFREKKLTEYAEKQIQSILRKMVQAGRISLEELEMEQSTPLIFSPSRSGGEATPAKRLIDRRNET